MELTPQARIEKIVDYLEGESHVLDLNNEFKELYKFTSQGGHLWPSDLSDLFEVLSDLEWE